LEATAAVIKLRDFAERMERLRHYVEADTKTEISKEDFENIPTRIISTSAF
jgi:hypothetical protein